jgi:hypothetical protein
VEVQVPSQLLWYASFMSLQKVANEEMIRLRNKFHAQRMEKFG